MRPAPRSYRRAAPAAGAAPPRVGVNKVSFAGGDLRLAVALGREWRLASAVPLRSGSRLTTSVTIYGSTTSSDAPTHSA